MPNAALCLFWIRNVCQVTVCVLSTLSSDSVPAQDNVSFSDMRKSLRKHWITVKDLSFLVWGCISCVLGISIESNVCLLEEGGLSNRLQPLFQRKSVALDRFSYFQYCALVGKFSSFFWVNFSFIQILLKFKILNACHIVIACSCHVRMFVWGYLN